MKRSLYPLCLPEVSLLIALLSLLSASRADAACEPPGSSKSDTILCSDTQTEGVAAKSGDDQIIVLRDASLLLESSGAPSPLVAIDAGSGNDTVVHLGRLSVNIILGEASLAVSSGGSEPCDSKSPPPPWDADKSDDHKKYWTFSRSNDNSRWHCPPPPSVLKAVGIDGGEGKDVLTSDGSLSVSVSDSNGNQPVAATGIEGGNGNDVIVQTGTMTVSASSEKATGPFSLQTSEKTSVPPPAGESASATAVGIAGGNGDDVLVNDGPLTVTASSKITSVTPSLSLTGGDEETSTTTAASKAVGIDAGTGKDDVTNSGAVTVTATSEVTSVHAELNLVDTSHGDAGTKIQSTAVGLDAGEGKDNVTIGNTGAITAIATSKSTSVNVEVNGADAATADATLQMEATAIGIEAGRGKDAVDNRGSVTAEAKSESVEVGVNVSFVDVTIADRRPSDVSTTLQSTAIGIDGGAAKDDGAIGNTGSVTAKATSSVHSTGVSLASEGVPGSTETFFEEGSLASIGINSRSDAFGLLGGAGADRLESGGTITANAEASAHQQSINLGMTIFNWHIPTPGLVLGSAGTRAEAESTGIAGGDGGDAIVHSGVLDVDATAKSSTTVVSVNLSEFAVDILPQGVPSIPISAALVVADSTTEAAAGATGIAGGGGDDTILNTGTITTDAVAKNGSVDVAGALGLKFEDGNEGGGTPSPGPSLSFETDVTLARAATDAVSQAAGIDGGAGHDEITNEGGVTVTAKSDTYAAAANFDILGSLEGKQGANPSILVGVAANDTSNNAASDAVGLQGGEGDDRIANNGTTTVTSNADALNVNAGVNLALDESGAMVGVSLAHSQSTATAKSTGIDGGAGTDEIANTGAIDTHATADATSVAVIATIESVSSKGLTAGATVIDASTTATSNAAGIRSGTEPDDQDDKNAPEKKSCCDTVDGTITNTGSVSADAAATTTAVDVGATISIAKKGAALGVTLTDASATANATAKGIEADKSDNTLLNEGNVDLTATSKAVAVAVDLTVEGTATGLAAGATLTRSSVTATSAATGIEGAEGNDQITNTGSISTAAREAGETDAVQSTATTVGVGVEASLAVKEGAVLGAALADTSAASTSRATGVDGGSGDDALLNQGEIDLNNVGADTTAVAVSIDLALAKSGLSIGAALAKSDAVSNVTVTGLEGGQGEDALTNEGSITLRQIDAEADAVSVSLGIAGAKEGVALGAALVDAGATTTAAATALSGGDGNDTLINSGSITGDDIKANADATGVSLQVTVAKEGLTVGAALADSDVTATSLVKGLDGGAGDDTLQNEGTVTLKNVKAEADAVSVGVGLAGAQDGVALAAGITDASGTGDSTAVGLDGGAGKDKVINKGGVTIENVFADGNATGISVELAGANAGVAAGVTLADTSGLAHATAKGLDGGAGDDALWNEGTIDLKQIESDADSVSVGVTLNIAMTGLAGGAALSRAEATGETKATGIDGGEGDDFIGSKGAITIDGVKANTDSTGVSVELGVTSSGVAVGAALADVSATAEAEAKGIDGGAGDDRLYNGGPITLKNIKADADAVSVGVSLNAAIEAGVAAGVSLADGSATAEVAATGIDGGGGNDTLVNAGAIRTENVEADAHATGVSVSLNVSLAGAAAGAAIADTSGTARATVRGLDGGAGEDQIFNTESGTISVAGTAKADAVSVGISISAALGVAAGAAITDVSTTAESTVMGLDGGAGIDQIQNDGGITATSNAQANATSISISIPLGIGAGAALADARSTATSTAAGINDEGPLSPSAMSVSGCGEESRCGGEGPVSRITNLGPVTSTATASSQGTSIAGNLAGFSLGETTNTATASAFGIRSGDGDDAIYNEGSLHAGAGAAATGLSVSVTLAGAGMGDAGTTAQGSATGIDGRAGDDVIENAGEIIASGSSRASAKSVSVGLAGVSDADASTTSLADARGIAGGEGDDRITNHGTLTVSAGNPTAPDSTTDCAEAAGGACAKSSSVAVELGGLGSTDASTTAIAGAIGLTGDGGDDQIVSDGAIDVTAHAKTGSNSVAVTLAGAALSNATTTAGSEATGISGGEGDDLLVAGGALHATASSGVVINNTGVSIAGATNFDATIAASARATGLDGGAGRDQIQNEATITAGAASTLSSSGHSNVIFGASSADAESGAFTDAAGIRAGAGDDSVFNSGTINAASTATLSLNSSTFSFGGAGGANGRLSASTRAAGIEGGAGADTIENHGDLTATATAALSSSGDSDVAFGSGSAGASSGASTNAVGLDGGSEDDVLLNQAKITVGSTAGVTLSGSSFTFGGAGGAQGVLSASTRSVGLDGGAGKDEIQNEGALDIDAVSTLTSSGNSDVAFGSGSAGATSGAITEAIGLNGGADDDTVSNSGRIDVDSTASLTLSSSSFSFGGTGGAEGSLTATTRSVGIAGGSGGDTIENDGEIHIGATSTLTASTGSDVAFGESGATSTSGAFTEAVGIDGGEGDDQIANRAKIGVTTSSTLTLSGSSYTFGGTGDVGGNLSAGTRAVGITGGAGNDTLGNDAEVTVGAASTLTSGGKVNTTFGTSATDALATTETNAVGLDGGEGDDTVENFGRVTVTADSTVTSANSAYVFGGTSTTGAVVKAGSNASGLLGGGGQDDLLNAGEVTVRSTATMTGSGSAYAEFGGAVTAGEVVASSTAVGIGAGDGDDRITNRGSVDVTSGAAATSTHSSDTGFLFGGGDSRAKGRVDLTGYGLDAGEGNNQIFNEGQVHVTLFGGATTSASSDGADIFDGDAYSRADATLTASAFGVRAGAGDDLLQNLGTIDVKTWIPFTIFGVTFPLPVNTSAGASADGDGIDGDGTAEAYATTTVLAAGIDVGGGNNRIANQGTVAVDLIALAAASASADADAGGSASVTPIPKVAFNAFGIRTGSGQDTIVNENRITVSAKGDGRAVGAAVGIDAGEGENLLMHSGSLEVSTVTDKSATAVGLQSGGGRDEIGVTETGSLIIRAEASPDLFINGTAAATGIASGGGGDLILLEGSLSVSSSSTGFAFSSAQSDAAGIVALGGANEIINRGTLSAASTAEAGGIAFVHGTAAGIRAGDGGNRVTNSGTIEVSANASGLGAGAQAVGIQTGAGNDTIINNGTITATQTVNGVTTPGTAIDAGAGDDTVALGAGSVTNGNINLGSGSNILSMEGTPVISGGIVDDASSLSLVFNNAGSYAGALPGVSAVKNGEGTFTLSMLNPMERVEINQGTLKLDNDYRFGGDTLLQVKVYGDGSHGQFFINGQTGLDGTLKIVRERGAYVNGTTYDVLKAANGIETNTAFSAVELPASTRLVSFQSRQTADTEQIEVEVARFTTVARTGNQRTVARQLDRLLPTASGEMNLTLGDAQGLSTDREFATAFFSLSPAAYGHLSDATLTGNQQYTNTLQDRMVSLRAGAFPSSVKADRPVRLAANGPLALNLSDDRRERANNYDVWLKAFGQRGDQDADGGDIGFKYSLGGLTLGADKRLTDTLTVGVSYGQAKNHVKADQGLSDGDIDSGIGSIYGDYFDRRLYVTGIFSYGGNQYDLKRNIVVGATTTSVTSSHDGRLYSGALGTGYYFQNGPWRLDPSLFLQYTRLDEDGFRERGGSAGLIVGERKTTLLVSTLGLRAARIIESGTGGRWIPEASLAWLHDYDIDDQMINASYVGAPDASFSIEGRTAGRNGAVLGLGIGYQTQAGFSTLLKYNGELRDQFSAHSIIGELRFDF